MAVPSRMVNGRDAAMRNCVVVELRRGRRPALHQDSYLGRLGPDDRRSTRILIGRARQVPLRSKAKSRGFRLGTRYHL